VTDTNATPDAIWDCTWPTMQEVLQDAGVSWKVYSPSNLGVSGKYASLAQVPTWTPALYDPITNPEIMVASDHVLPYFPAFRNPLSPLFKNAFTPTFPNDFVADIASGSLPSVSWMIPPLGFDEHPSSAPANGMYFTSLVLDALVANPAVWSKTALFLMYDENDGWFDHVAPPTAPAGTPGEYLTAAPSKVRDPKSDTLGIEGPLGLGVRVPCLAISPFSRGGHIASETFDALRRPAPQRLRLAAQDRRQPRLDPDRQAERVGAHVARDRRRHAAHRRLRRHQPGHGVRRRRALDPHKADHARPGRHDRSRDEVLPRVGGAGGGHPRRSPHPDRSSPLAAPRPRSPATTASPTRDHRLSRTVLSGRMDG
jgi:hypothetical protein